MKTAFFVFFTGLLLTMFGVGGIEQSLDDAGLASGVLVATLGLLIMWCGTLMMQAADELDREYL